MAAERDGQLTGGALCREMTDEADARRGGEDNLIVDGKFRRQGLAKQLMELVEAYYRDRGLVGMQTCGTADDEPALALFESLGYRIVKRCTRSQRVTAFGTQPPAERIRMAKDF